MALQGPIMINIMYSASFLESLETVGRLLRPLKGVNRFFSVSVFFHGLT